MTHIQVKKNRLLTFIAFLNSSILYILPVSRALSAVLCELSLVVHRGLSAAGQLVTLVYRGKINDLTLWGIHIGSKKGAKSVLKRP